MAAAKFNPSRYSAFKEAEAFIAKGRNKHSRTVGANRDLRWINEDAIALRLHNTDIVTYYRDGTFGIYGGGWNTVTTKKWINEYAPIRLHSLNYEWIIGTTGEFTAPKVQKCRKCSKTGPTWQTDIVCYPARYRYFEQTGTHGSLMCEGGKQEHDVALPERYYMLDKPERDAVWAAHRESPLHDEPCEHGHMDKHQHTACEHGVMGGHKTGIADHTCYGCNGTGMRDYGSKPIPITVSPSERFYIDVNGNLLDEAPNSNMPTMYAQTKPSTYVPPTPYSYGSEVLTQLARVVPGVTEKAKHPVNMVDGKISDIIMNLNDTHKWTRERIADWLDTLDNDLRFKV